MTVSIFRKAANVRMAKLRAQAARQAVGKPASALLARERKYPLTTVGGAAGAGFVLGTLNVHLLRVPGLSALLSGGLAEVVVHGTRLIAELGSMGLGAAARDAFTDDGGEQP
jgi:hypothetical protein